MKGPIVITGAGRGIGAATAAQVPMQRGGTPTEVAHAIWSLLAPEASYITGALLDVAGGR